MSAINWKNAVSGGFSTAADWNGGVVPGSADDALLTVAGSAYTVTTSASQTVNSLQTASNATLAVAANFTFQMTNGTGAGANAGQISLANNTFLFLGGTFNNTSTVAGGGVVLNGVANATEIRLISTTTTFTGGGSVVLGTAGNNFIFGNSGAADTLDNVNNTISGVGNVGNGGMTMINEAAGVVNANQTGQLTLNVNGGVTNTGTLEATNTGGLFILNTGVTNTGGTVKAVGSGAHVDLQNSTITGGTFTAGAGAQIDVVANQTSYVNGASAGAPVTITSGTNFNVNNNAFLYLSGAVTNNGVITLLGTANASELRLRTSTTTLTGGGQVVLAAGGNDFILGDAGSANTLVNVNNTISGVGNVGNGGMTFVNQTAGVVNANQTGQLTIQVNGGVTNAGTLEATNSGGLFILNTGVDNTAGGDAGKISATVSGAHVDLQNTTITGGTLSAVSGAQIDVVANQAAFLDGSLPGGAITIATGTNFNVNNNSTAYLYGSIVNDGTINLLGVANNAVLRLVTPVVTLSGGGKVVLGTAGSNQIFGNSGALNELDNVNNTISGVGNIGAGGMTLLNETAGVINADQTGQLVLQDNGGVTNRGLLEATNTGGLFILNTGVDDTTNGNAGVIKASGAGAHVDLQNTTIYGGSLTSTGAGAQIDIVSGQAATLNGSFGNAPVNITAGSTFQINNNSALHLSGVINNAGAINLGVNAEPNSTGIRLDSANVTLQGGGVVNMSNSSNNYIVGNNNGNQTLNNLNNTIQGSGNIGAGGMTLINGASGIIASNQAPGVAGSGLPGQLIIQANGGVTNSGVIEATVASGSSTGSDLFILNTYIKNISAGVVEALGSASVGGVVDLQNSTIEGGFLTTTGAGVIEVVSGQQATLNGIVTTVSTNGTINVLNNSTLNLEGKIGITKTINLQAAANTSVVNVANALVKLSGGGKITMGASANNIITSNAAGDLDNFDDIIQGSGNIGNGSAMGLINETRGVINANNQTVALILQESRAVENTGLIESNTSVSGAGGLLVLNTVVDNTTANSTGVLNTGLMTAAGTGHIDLQNSNIYGGTLTSTGSGFFDVVSGQAAGLNGTVLGQAVNIAGGTQFNVNNNSTLFLYGAINNAGTINLLGTTNNSVLSLNSSVTTLTGGGQIVMGGNGSNFIVQNQGNAQLDNLNNGISGSGNIGNGGSMYLTNETGGTIDSTTPSGIHINLGGVQTINAGVLVATGGPLTVTNAVFNSGWIIADGGNVTIGGNVNGAGKEIISGASTLEIGSSVGGLAAQAVQFTESAGGTSTGVFKIDNAQSFTGSVADLATGDKLDLGNINSASATFSYSGNSSGGVLTVTDGSTTANINLVGNYNAANFTLINDGGGHTDVTYTGTPMAPMVADTAANLSNAALDTLQANPTVTSILVTDSGLGNGGFVKMSQSELVNDATAIGKLVFANSNPVALQVVDTAINLSGTKMDQIAANTHVKSIVVSDNGSSNSGFVQLGAFQITNDAAALAGLVFANGQTAGVIRINDTASHISSNLTPVATDKAVGKIVVTDNVNLTSSVLHLTTDAAAFNEAINGNGTAITIKVIDTAANESGAALDTMQANAKVSAVVVSDNNLVVSNVAQLTTDAATIGKIAFANAQTTNVVNTTDTAANVSAALGSLNTNTKVGQITLSDNGVVKLNVAAYNGDTTAIGKLHNANATTVLFDVADTSTNLNGATMSNLINAGDIIDATNINFATISATFTENAAGTEGTLHLSDGTHTAAVNLFGQYAAANFSGSATAAGFSVANDGGAGTKLTLLSTVPA